ncbi:bestrophin-like domain [Bradyrhizobium sp. Arg314]
MLFGLFASGVTAVFFATSLSLLNYGRRLGLRFLRRHGADSMPGLPTVEGAIFALMGLLLAFTISGALQRFDERRQLVVQEANAISTAYDRLGLFEGQAGDLRKKLKEYTKARIDLYQMPHDFSVWQGAEVWSRQQQGEIGELKNRLWDAILAACPQANFRPACPQTLSTLTTAFEVARLRLGAAEKHPPQIVYAMLFGLGLGGSLLAGFSMATAPARSWAFRKGAVFPLRLCYVG